MKSFDAASTAMRTIRHLVIVAAMLGLTATNAKLNAQSASTNFVSFQDFVADTATAASSDYLARPTSQVKDAATFEQMRQYILTMYQGVNVNHSFVEDSQYFDCVPIAQQPTARLLGITDIDPPPAELPPGLGSSAEQSLPAIASTSMDTLDQFGNTTTCEVNTIPMARMTLDEMTGFATLHDFQMNGQDGSAEGPAGDDLLPPANNGHRYAREYQFVKNLGGRSELSLWDPPIGDGDQFTLSQQWYVGGTGAAKQTVEGGWSKYPKFFKPHSALFIFYTPDNYQNGCYNLRCPAFMQEDESWEIGGEFPKYSTIGGEQHWFSMEWYLVPNSKGKKNWWLLLKRDSDDQWKWIGYYPEKEFNGGQLTKNAEKIAYGGETAVRGVDTWPVMGSKEWPAQGWTKAAYQSNIKYTATDLTVTTPDLTPYQPSPACYKVGKPAMNNPAAWGTYFFFGGPGGNPCNENKQGAN
jgi:hypothetical protein